MQSTNFTQQEQNLIYAIALQALGKAVNSHQLLDINLADFSIKFQKKGASFVTINKQDTLRGCIGTLTAYRPLITDIAFNTYAAALEDPRFPEVTITELASISINISILSTPTEITFTDENDLLQQLRPNIDGLIFEDLGRRGTFLPSVWESLPDRVAFFNNLKQKAGFPASYWSKSIKCYRYTVDYICHP